MHYHRAVVYGYPFGIVVAIVCKRFLFYAFAYIVAHSIGNRLYLTRRIALAYYEIRARSVQFGHIYYGYVLGFLLLHTGYYGFDKFLVVVVHLQIIFCLFIIGKYFLQR